jgi:hypothetical protein
VIVVNLELLSVCLVFPERREIGEHPGETDCLVSQEKREIEEQMAGPGQRFDK